MKEQSRGGILARTPLFFPKASGVALVTFSHLALKNKSRLCISCSLQGMVNFSPWC